MEGTLQEITSGLKNNDDFFEIYQDFGKEKLIFLGLNSLMDVPKTLFSLKERLNNESAMDNQFTSILFGLGENIIQDKKAIISSILEGKLVILLQNDQDQAIVVNPYSKMLSRSIEAPTNENTLQGGLSSFNEDLDTNLGIIRKQIVSENLLIKAFTLSNEQSRKVSLIYFKGSNKPYLETLEKRLKENIGIDPKNLQNLNRLMGIPRWSLVSHFTTTELPQEANNALERGRAVLFIDRLPYAFITPGRLEDMFFIENDENFPYPIMIAIRFLRIAATLLTLIIPGLYVALVSVNPEVLRIELALSLAESRDGVPYPALVETLLMLITLELIIEASVRLPKSIGPTITMVGGIILGQAAVEAKLVSNLLIIILAATTIANSTIIGVQHSTSIRLFKYLILVLASFFGVLGILVGVFFVCSYYASITTLGVPFINFNFSKGDIKSG
ncbi:spore germination protein [Sutcliffiella halmapala]